MKKFPKHSRESLLQYIQRFHLVSFDTSVVISSKKTSSSLLAASHRLSSEQSLLYLAGFILLVPILPHIFSRIRELLDDFSYFQILNLIYLYYSSIVSSSLMVPPLFPTSCLITYFSRHRYPEFVKCMRSSSLLQSVVVPSQ